jgi:dTDP-6-deoxy-L-talose 4-dehydrogenase (NAD+)
LKVLLVGSTGFIGKQIYAEMLKNNWKVMELNRSFSGGRGFFDQDSIKHLLAKEEFDCVVSTAWTTSHSTYRESKVNFEYQFATENLAREAKGSNVGIFVALGSSAEYGSYNLQANCLDSELRANDSYSRSKIDTFNTLSHLFRDSNTRFIWPRIFQPFGSGQDPKRFIPYLISSFINNRTPDIANPSHIYDWVNVSDVAKAIIFSITKPVNGAVDVGTSIGTSNKDLARLVSQAVASTGTLPNFSSEEGVQGLVMSTKSVLLSSGWKPDVDLISGVRELVAQNI